MNRVMIAGTHSGCGKTTITCAILQTLKNRGLDVTAFKSGPDYIDPMFHKTVIETPSYNLDTFFMDKNTVNYLLAKNSTEISIIEGMMGFYDGINFTERASSFELSAWTNTPVILVVDVKGIGNSIKALLKGYLEYKGNNIKGVIFNGISALGYEQYKSVCDLFGVRALGYFNTVENAKIESRHLGLVTAVEIDDLKDKMQLLADQAKSSLDIEGILEIASTAGEIRYKDIQAERIADVKIAVAYDKAFCFYYEDNMQLLRELGAKFVTFSPLADEDVPKGVDGLMLGGGYPELYAAKLSANESMLKSIKEHIENGLPTIAECGGFMYLHDIMSDIMGKPFKMAGVINGRCIKTDRLQRFGYTKMTANKDNMLCKKGTVTYAHEYHYYDSEDCGDTFTAQKADGSSWQCINGNESLAAGFPHMHFYANTELAENFVKKCEKYKIREKDNV